MKILLLIYLIGVIVNAIVALTIWGEMKRMDILDRMRYAVIIPVVLLSVATWVMVAVVLIAEKVKNKRRERKNGNDGSDIH